MQNIHDSFSNLITNPTQWLRLFFTELYSTIPAIPPADELHFTNYYASIYLSNNNELKAYSKNGFEYTLNERNGCILKKELIKSFFLRPRNGTGLR